MLNKITDCIICIICIIISDHAAVSLSYKNTKFIKNPPKWHFQIGWLQDPEFIEYLNKQIDLYFEFNNSETSAGIRWEAFKAFIQGHIICFCSSKARRSRQEMKQLEDQIKKLENDIFQKTTDTEEANEKLLLQRSQYNELSASKAALKVLRLKQKIL